MIKGIGIDLVDVERVERLLATYGERFAQRVLAPVEREPYAASARRNWFLASRFAAKEAVSKALGTGLRYPVTLHGISVVTDAVGRPELRFHGPLPQYLKSAQVGAAHLSITHEKGFACAVVVLERAGRESE
jgi:holo-[acyl-carrier protein] synthase